MRVLVVYGSKRGGTRGIARTVAATLLESGHRAEAWAACEVDRIDDFDAVIVGGALYAGIWHAEARRFVQHHADQLRTMPVFFFSSGPLDASATNASIPPTRSVKRLMDLVQARGHVTFGGRLRPDAHGFIAQNLVRGGKAGDWRDIAHIDSWTRSVAGVLDTLPCPVANAVRWRTRRRARHLAATLTFFTGATAVLGGLELLIWRNGAPWLPDLSLLEGTGFASFLVPGLLLLGVVGTSNLLAATLLLRRHRHEQRFVLIAGLVLTGFIVSEMRLLMTVHWLHLVYLAIGLATVAVATWLELQHARRAPPARPSQHLARTS